MSGSIDSTIDDKKIKKVNSRYDKVLDDKEFEKYLREKGIPQGLGIGLVLTASPCENARLCICWSLP